MPFAGDAGQTIKMKGIELKGVPTYLDMQATTPLDPRVLDRMLPYWTTNFGNPHSRTHLYGWESEDAVEVARAQVANLVGACLPNWCLVAFFNSAPTAHGLLAMLPYLRTALLREPTKTSAGFPITYVWIALRCL